LALITLLIKAIRVLSGELKPSFIKQTNSVTFSLQDTEVTGLVPGAYQIFGEAVGLEQGPLSLIRITAELLE
jgi:hypothetical protein